MIIHRVTLGETIHSIAKKHSISVIKLMGDNELADEKIAVGEELIIIKPTREAPVLLGDSISKLALRFGVRKNSLYCLNPWIAREEYLRPGQMLTVKASPPTHGTANALGIADRLTGKRKFKAALPFLTYIACMEYTLSDCTLKRTAQLKDIRELGKRHSRTMLLGISLSKEALYTEGDARGSLIESITELARSDGYDGIYLRIEPSGASDDMLSGLLLSLKNYLLGKNLILVSELSGKTISDACEISDATAVKAENLALSDKDSAGALIEFAKENESSKCFLMPSYLATAEDERLYLSDALRIARRGCREITKHQEEKSLGFSYSKFHRGRATKVNIKYPSLERVQEEMRLAKELGFGGFAFDIEATPVSYFCIFNALFARADYISLLDEAY